MDCPHSNPRDLLPPGDVLDDHFRVLWCESCGTIPYYSYKVADPTTLTGWSHRFGGPLTPKP